MNQDMKIDTNLLSQEISKIKTKRDRLNEIYNEIKKNNSELKDNWKSLTSDVVFNNFEDFYTGYEEELNNLQNDIDFLNSIVSKYEVFESKNNQTVDEKIAI